MKKYQFILIGLLVFSASSCVQKAYKKTVVITLTVQNGKDIEMKPLIKDTLYTATATTITGYKFAEIKFTVNGEFELKEQPNRRLVFSERDTTFYNAVFNLVQ
jgi:hypothetical protein